MAVRDRKTILLVEDEPLIAVNERESLERYGYDVIAVNSGEKAVSAIADREGIDLVLMDIDLGKGIDGTEAATRILRIRDLPIVFLSCHMESEIVRRTESITSYGYVVKNSDFTVLDASVKMAFKLFDADQALKRSERDHAMLFDTISEGIALNECVYDDRGKIVDYRIVKANAAFYAISGLGSGEAIGRLATKLYGMTPDAISSFWEENRASPRVAHAELYIPKGEKWFSISISPIVEDRFVTSIVDISAQKELNLELERNIKALNDHIEHSPMATIVWDSNFIVTKWAGEAERMLGWKATETIGKNIKDLGIVYEEDIPVVAERMERLVDSSTNNVVGTNRNITKDGRIVTCEWYNTTVFDRFGKLESVMSQVLDITDRVKLMESLRESEERLQLVLEGSGLGYWDWDLATNVVIRNERWAQMLGFSQRELECTTRQWAELCHPDDYDYIWKSVHDHLEGRSNYYNISYRLRTKDGSYKWILDSGAVARRDSEGHALRACGTHRDITVEKEKELRIKDLLAEKELILQEVHHRIKNNMNTMISLVFLQRKGQADPGVTRALEDVESRFRSIMLLYEKLNQTGAISRMSLRNYLPTLVEAVVANFPNGKSVELRIEVEDIVLKAKPLQTLGIIVNELLTNIMKYAFDGCEDPAIAVVAGRVGDKLSFSIHDNGVGMPEGVDFDNSTGFGLMLISQLTRQLDGSIRIERESGTRIVLEFGLDGSSAAMDLSTGSMHEPS